MHPHTLSTLTNAEFDSHAGALDDPAAFLFDRTAGVVGAGAGHVSDGARFAGPRDGPVDPTVLQPAAATSSVLAGRNITRVGMVGAERPLLGSTAVQVAPRVPMPLTVRFRPRAKRRYRSVFKLCVMHGADVGQEVLIELCGEGSHEEGMPLAAIR
jgi:hypothetical protein